MGKYFAISLIAMLAVCATILVANRSYAEELSLSDVFLQPFNLYFDRNDEFVMLWPEGHPAYEAVEAMIKFRKDKEPWVRVILTRHDATQVHLMNDEPEVQFLKKVSNIEVYCRPISYIKTYEDEKPQIIMEFTTHKDERVLFDFRGLGKPSAQYARVSSGGRHASTTIFPLMYSERVTLAAPGSRVVFDGKAYEPAVQKQPHFTSVNGNYTDSFEIMALRVMSDGLKLESAPIKMEAGQAWVYDQKGAKQIYTIESVSGDTLTIRKRNEVVVGELKNGALSIRKIFLTANTLNKKSMFTFDFNPALPVTIGKASSSEGKFTMSIDEFPNLVTGNYKVSSPDAKTLGIMILPSTEDWKTKGFQVRAVKTGSDLVIKRTFLK